MRACSSPCCGRGWKASRLPEIGKEKPGQCVRASSFIRLTTTTRSIGDEYAI